MRLKDFMKALANSEATGAALGAAAGAGVLANPASGFFTDSDGSTLSAVSTARYVVVPVAAAALGLLAANSQFTYAKYENSHLNILRAILVALGSFAILLAGVSVAGESWDRTRVSSNSVGNDLMQYGAALTQLAFALFLALQPLKGEKAVASSSLPSYSLLAPDASPSAAPSWKCWRRGVTSTSGDSNVLSGGRSTELAKYSTP